MGTLTINAPCSNCGRQHPCSCSGISPAKRRQMEEAAERAVRNGAVRSALEDVEDELLDNDGSPPLPSGILLPSGLDLGTRTSGTTHPLTLNDFAQLPVDEVLDLDAERKRYDPIHNRDRGHPAGRTAPPVGDDDDVLDLIGDR